MVLGVRPDAASCTGLVKIYWTATGEVHALKGVDAEFPGGAITAVVGPSGSGKSSLLRILACIDRPTAGQVRVGGTEVAGMKPGRRRLIRKQQIGYMFQRPAENLVSYLTATQHLEMSARLRGASAEDEGPELLDALGLRPRADHLPSQLSGGEQQRLALASAVIGNPALVLADEPTAELDSESARHLMEKVVELRDRGLSFVVATHDPVAMKVADVILHLRHGAMEAETSEDRLLSIIDAFGRIQLPAGALRLFPDRRAVVTFDEGEVRITPP